MISIAPDILAALTEAAPGRLVRKLDKDPQMAKAWDWQESDSEVKVSNGKETVTFSHESGNVSSIEQISCTCLLAPRCLHILASSSLLEVSAGSPGSTASDDLPGNAEAEPEEEEVSSLTEAAIQSAANTYEFGGVFLSTASLAACLPHGRDSGRGVRRLRGAVWRRSEVVRTSIG